MRCRAIWTGHSLPQEAIGLFTGIYISHIFSLMLADNISKSIYSLKTTIKDLGREIYPNQNQFESNAIFAYLEKPFEKNLNKIKSVK